MEVKHVKGDLIEMARKGHFDTVAHCCNCFGQQSSGIAPKLNALSHGELLKADKKTPIGDINKLGRLSWCSVYSDDGKPFEIFNLYGMFCHKGQLAWDTGRKAVLVNWDALEQAMLTMFDNTQGGRIGIPLMGCGLANGSRISFDNMIMRLQYAQPVDYDIELTVVTYESPYNN